VAHTESNGIYMVQQFEVSVTDILSKEEMNLGLYVFSPTIMNSF